MHEQKNKAVLYLCFEAWKPLFIFDPHTSKSLKKNCLSVYSFTIHTFLCGSTRMMQYIDKASATHLKCIFALHDVLKAFCICQDVKKNAIRNCPTHPLYSGQNHLNAHHAIITTTRLISRNLPGGLEGSSSSSMFLAQMLMLHINER